MLYLDTAVVLTLFVGEGTSVAVESWLATRRQPLAFSDWGLTECASALGLKCRRGELDAGDAANALMAMTGFVRKSCELIACAPHHQVDAQEMLGRFDLPLRAGDALHLAISRHARATLVTYDNLLLASAKALGIKAFDPLDRTR